MHTCIAVLILLVTIGSASAQEKQVNRIDKAMLVAKHEGQSVYAIHFERKPDGADKQRGITLVKEICKHNLEKTEKVQIVDGRQPTVLLVVIDANFRADRAEQVKELEYAYDKDLHFVLVKYEEKQTGFRRDLFAIFAQMNNPGKDVTVSKATVNEQHEEHSFRVFLKDKKK